MTTPDPTPAPATATAVSGPRGRSGTAARKRTSAGSSGSTAEKPDGAKASRATKRRTRSAATAAGPTSTETSATADAVVSTPTPAAEAQVKTELERLAAELPAEVQDALMAYRPQMFDDEEWAVVGDLVRLGCAAYGPRTYKAFEMARMAFRIHAGVHLRAGTSRTITGWYSDAAIRATLNAKDHGITPRSINSHAAKLRHASQVLLPHTVQPTPHAHAYTPESAYSTADLEAYFDFLADHPRPHLAGLLEAAIWLTLGCGAWDCELRNLTGTAFTLTSDALLVALPGDGDRIIGRTVAVHHTAELPVLTLAYDAGDGLVLADPPKGRSLTSLLVSKIRFPDSLPGLTNRRLRATWLALVIGSHVPLTALLPAAGVRGDRSFGHVIAGVEPLEAADAARLLRGSTGPLPTPGQLLLPGAQHALPRVPLRNATTPATVTGPTRKRRR